MKRMNAGRLLPMQRVAGLILILSTLQPAVAAQQHQEPYNCTTTDSNGGDDFVSFRAPLPHRYQDDDDGARGYAFRSYAGSEDTTERSRSSDDGSDSLKVRPLQATTAAVAKEVADPDRARKMQLVDRYYDGDARNRPTTPERNLDRQAVESVAVAAENDRSSERRRNERGYAAAVDARRIVTQQRTTGYEDDHYTRRLGEPPRSGSFDDEKEESTTTSDAPPPRKESNVSRYVFPYPSSYDLDQPKLDFPNKSDVERYKMPSLRLDRGLFAFDFLRSFLSAIQPRDVPLELLRDAVEGRVEPRSLIAQSLRLEMPFLALVAVLAALALVVPCTELWLCCRPASRESQRRGRTRRVLFLAFFAVVMGSCAVTMLVCNEEIGSGVDAMPATLEAALQDLRDYHTGAAGRIRKCLTRSLDVASEAVLADLDNVEELLGKPVQSQLSQDTGVDVALNTLMDVANASTELAHEADGLLQRAERARESGAELSRECDELRRELERASRDCAPEDRSLCAVLDPSGLHLALRLDRVARDERLVRLRKAGHENLTELGRQARGEYLYIPHHVSRSTLEARNSIRREMNTARAKVSDEARHIEAVGSDVSSQLDNVGQLANDAIPYIETFEYYRWFVGFGTSTLLLLAWLLLLGALCCGCGSSSASVRPTLLCFVFLGCLVSVLLWAVLVASLAIASHAEMLICRPLDDPQFRALEALLETRAFLGRRLSVPLKDLLEECEQRSAEHPAFQLEKVTAHWTWPGLTRSFAKLKADLTGTRIMSPGLRERLQNLLYATGANLTEHRIMIQGPILNKDLSALSDQVENVARQLSDRRTARSFRALASQMRDLLSRRVKPLMKLQDELVYHLAALELQLVPLRRRVNESLTQLRSVQYYVDAQGETVGLLKAKGYVDRMSNYLDQWRAHVLAETSSGVSKCRPLWDVLQGVRLLLCGHILGPLNGYWFATFVCVLVMLFGVPSSHSLATSYWKKRPGGGSISSRGSVLLPSRQGSPDTLIMERETWRTPDPAPSVDSW